VYVTKLAHIHGCLGFSEALDCGFSEREGQVVFSLSSLLQANTFSVTLKTGPVDVRAVT